MWSFLVWLLVIWSHILCLDQIGYLSWSILVGSLKFDHLSFEKIVVTKFFGHLVIYLSFYTSGHTWGVSNALGTRSSSPLLHYKGSLYDPQVPSLLVAL